MTYPEPDNIKIIDLETIDSTNSYIKRNHDDLKNEYPVIVFAESQYAGRGRDDREWLSLRNKGLFCSIGVKIKNINNLNFLSLSIGLAISEFLTFLTNKKFQIKWPNDLLFNNRKIAGILVENIVLNNNVTSIIGVGVNINNDLENFPLELQQNVTSLKIISKKKYVIKEIRNRLINYIFKWLDILEKNKNKLILNKFNELSVGMINKDISFHYNNRIIRGIFKGISDNGAIIIEDKNKNIKKYYSGEIV